MARQFEFPVTRSLNFPEQCVCCGNAKEAEVPMNVKRLVMKGQKQVEQSATVQVPLCLRCKRADQRVLLLRIGSFAIGLLVVGLAGVILMVVADAKVGIIDETTNIPSQPGAWLTLVCGVPFIAGTISGFLFEAVVKVLFIPVMGRALYYAPFLGVQMLGDIEYVAGLTGRISKDGKTLQLKFFNDNVGDAFAKLNP